jgi:glycerol uptake facilitator-like aquaporin
MRSLSAAAIISALTTFVAALALRAPDATLSVLAVGAFLALATWVSAMHSTDEESGLALLSPAAAVTLALVGRRSTALLLPLVAAQVVGAVAGGFAALGLEDELTGTLVWDDPTRVATGVVVAVLALLASWLLLALDSGESPAWSVAPPLLAGASLGVAFAAALNPAVVLGLATADLVSWEVAGIAAVAGLVGSAVGPYAIALVTPAE